MRFGLIGGGWIVERCHAPSMLRVDDLQVVAVADPAPGRAELVGELFGLLACDCVTDYRELLARNDIDAVSIGTPPATHREIIEAVAAAGKHLICEKPLATTLADADACIAAAEGAGITLAMYHNYLYYHGPRVAKELVDSGVIGTVIATEIRGMGLRPWVGNEAYRPGWRFTVDQGGGGALMDAGVHALYLTELLHGAPDRLGLRRDAQRRQRDRRVGVLPAADGQRRHRHAAHRLAARRRRLQHPGHRRLHDVRLRRACRLLRLPRARDPGLPRGTADARRTTCRSSST